MSLKYKKMRKAVEAWEIKISKFKVIKQIKVIILYSQTSDRFEISTEYQCVNIRKNL